MQTWSCCPDLYHRGSTKRAFSKDYRQNLLWGGCMQNKPWLETLCGWGYGGPPGSLSTILFRRSMSSSKSSRVCLTPSVASWTEWESISLWLPHVSFSPSMWFLYRLAIRSWWLAVLMTFQRVWDFVCSVSLIWGGPSPVICCITQMTDALPPMFIVSGQSFQWGPFAQPGIVPGSLATFVSGTVAS